MFLKSVKIKNFKALQDFERAFEPGVNIIFGPNEVGKSTFLDALHAGFFVKADSKGQEVEGFHSWEGRGDPFVTVSFQHNGNEYLLEKRFLGERQGRLACAATGLDLPNKDRIQEELAGMIPLYTEKGDSVRRTFWITQGELEDTPHVLANDATIRASLKRLAFEADGNIEAIKKKINEEIRNLGVGLDRPAKYLGHVAAARAEYERLQGEYEKAEKAFRSLESETARQKELIDTLAQLRSRIDEDRKVLDAHNGYREALEKLEKANADFDAIQRDVEQCERNRKEIAELEPRRLGLRKTEEEMKQRIAGHEAAKEAEAIETRLQNGRELAAALDALDVEIRLKDRELRAEARVTKSELDRARMLAGNIREKLASLQAAQIQMSARGLADVDIAVSIDGGVAESLRLDKGQISTYRANQSVKVSVGRVIDLTISSGVKDAVKLQEELQTDEKQLADLLKSVDAGTVEGLAERYGFQEQIAGELNVLEKQKETKLNGSTVERVQEGIGELEQQLGGLRATAAQTPSHDGRTVESLNEERANLNAELGGLEIRIKQLQANEQAFVEQYGSLDEASSRKRDAARGIAVAKAALEAIPKMELPDDQILLRNTRLAENVRRFTELERESLTLGGRLQSVDVLWEEVKLKETLAEEARAKYKSWTTELDAYRLVSDALLESEKKVAENLTSPIEEMVSFVLPRLTARRYSSVSLDNQLSVQHVDFGQREVGVEELSTGAQGQLALALRLAVIRYFSGKERQTVIMDDAFANFDSNRLNEAQAIVNEFAVEHQVIYLTCHGQMKEWPGANVIEM